MKDWASLIQAIAQFIGPFIVPATVLIIVLFFKEDIRGLLGRFKAGEMDAFGVHVKADLAERIEQLHEVVGEAVAESEAKVIQQSATAGVGLSGFVTPTLLVPSQTIGVTETLEDHQKADAVESDVVAEIVNLAASSPKVALIELSSVLEHELRHLAAAMGFVILSPTIGQLANVLQQNDLLSRNEIDSIKQFQDVRNRLVHGRVASDDEIISAIDSGLTLVKLIHAIPRAVHVVLKPGVPVFADPQAIEQRPDVLALILESTSAGGLRRFQRVLPIPANAVYSKGEHDLLPRNCTS